MASSRAPNGTARVFISYARSDGEKFARQLHHRLDQSGVAAWLDHVDMEGGRDWWQQIQGALGEAEFVVLVATPAALRSENVRREWLWAREHGRCLYPVRVPLLLPDFESLPRWMTKTHFYDLEKEWETFLNYLKRPCTAIHAPFMAPPLPATYVERPREFESLVQSLLAERRGAVAITTALRGAGGFGKTTLAAALCHDERIRLAYPDGIFWTTLGENPRLIEALQTLYAAVTDQHLVFIDEKEASSALARALEDRDCLIVVDDVWQAHHARLFRGGEHCSRLITTRDARVVAEAAASQVLVDEMTIDESVRLLSAKVEPPIEGVHGPRLQALARRLGEWPLLLEIAASMLRQQLALPDSPNHALSWLEATLDKHGVLAVVRDDPDRRKQSVAGVLAASLDTLTADDRERFAAIAIFPEDVEVPAAVVAALWGFAENDVDAHSAIRRLALQSLMRFNPDEQTVRLHDVVREYLLRDQQRSLVMRHRRFLDERRPASGNWADLRQKETYLWRYLAHHLLAARGVSRSAAHASA